MTSREPQAGDRYDAPWGSYAVLRVNADASVTLQDLNRPTATVRPTAARLAADYVLVQAAQLHAPPVLEPKPAEPKPEPAEIAVAATAPAWVEPGGLCAECKRPCRVLWASDDEDGPMFCGLCLSSGGTSRIRSAPAVRLAGDDDTNEARAEIGSVARPTNAAPRPAPAPPTAAETRDLWTETTKSVAR